MDEVLQKANNNNIKVAIVFGKGESYMLATDKSYVGDLLNSIGIFNITDELEADSAYVNFSMEQVLDINSD